jgi:osmoprotectant transport system permease protein
MKSLIFVGIYCCSIFALASAPTRIGSKIFTEGYILAEILAVQLEKNNFRVERLGGLGATGITEAAMKQKEIDLIVDYSGSVAKAFLNSNENISHDQMKRRLNELGFDISRPLGFNNTFALAVTKEFAQKNEIKTISDLNKLKSIKAAFTSEFTQRKENWKGLKNKYNLNQFEIFEMDHQLAYEALKAGKADIVEAYSTDAKLKQYELFVLEDDQNYFPRYDGIVMTHLDWKNKNPEQWRAIQLLEDQFNDELMTDLNSQADFDKKSFNQIASDFLNVKAQNEKSAFWRQIGQATTQHLGLVIFPLIFAFFIGVPLAFISFSVPVLHSPLGLLSSVFQTVPALAFLALLVPFLGIGGAPAMVVLSLYALLPIYLGAYRGFQSYTNEVHLMCHTLNLSPWFKFKKIQWPLALPTILTGLQTATISTVASATLAALIGSGGYGKLIIGGLAVNDMKVVLMGAIPAAIMAILFQFSFDYLNRRINNK